MSAAEGKPVLSVRDLVKSFQDDGPVDRQEVLNHLDFEVSQGEFVCILGPSGCGKSTLLRCIAGFEAYEGEILLREYGSAEPDRPGMSKNNGCVMVFQDFSQLFPWKTVEENVMFPLQIQGMKDRELRRKTARQYLAMASLEGYGSYYPHQLSGGMKMRAAIARALAMKPQLILMDEPLASLDAMTRNNLQGELIRIHDAEKMTVLFITHNIQEAICLGSRIMVMSAKGEILTDMANPLKKPVSPSSEGYGALWDQLHALLYAAGDGGKEQAATAI